MTLSEIGYNVVKNLIKEMSLQEFLQVKLKTSYPYNKVESMIDHEEMWLHDLVCGEKLCEKCLKVQEEYKNLINQVEDKSTVIIEKDNVSFVEEKYFFPFFSTNITKPLSVKKRKSFIEVI